MAFSAAAQAQQVQRVEIRDVGIYKAKVTGSDSAPGTAAGIYNTITNEELQERTTTIPAKLGIRFGFHYSIIGTPNNTPITLKMVTRYPPPGLHNPATGNTLLRGEYSRTKKLGTADNYRDYGFDDEWELVPGTWTFEIWQDDRKLAEQSFTVVKP